MLLLLVSVALFFNIIVVYYKLTHDRILDGFIDAALLSLVAMFFSGSTDALFVGTLASALISIYLFFSPLKFDDTPPKKQEQSYEF